MTQTTSCGLKLLICEDEYLLAMDMAQQFEAMRAEVVGIVGSLSGLREAVLGNAGHANAVVLDIQFADGHAFDVLPLLEEQDLAVVIVSGYGLEERPDEYAHIPWITKPATAERIATALCSRVDERGASQIV